jgi:malate synthase
MIMLRRTLSLAVITCFFLTTLGPLPKAHADTALGLPTPGTMINLSPSYEPVIIKGLNIHKDNPFLFDFIVDVGQDRMSGEPLKKEGEKLIKYFLASLAIPDKDVWVNLSPYEKNKMIPEALGQTDMGRDLLEQDYILKQITASLIYPEKQLGKTFWDKVYSRSQEMYGTTQVPVNTFNKVWIMADRAEVFERNQTAFVVSSHLKVMLEEDYLALQKHTVVTPAKEGIHTVGSQIVREIILPQLEKEVNTGRNFANLRQILNSIILANWYKNNLKQALLNQVYANQSKVRGIDLNDPTVKQKIYEQYLKAYKVGVFNYIKEDVTTQGDSIPRKYFSGGFIEGQEVRNPARTTDAALLAASLPSDRAMMDLNVGFDIKPQAQAGSPDAAMFTFRQDEKVGDVSKAFPEVLNPEVLDVLAKLAPRTEDIHALLAKEAEEYAAQAARGEEPGFLPTTANGEDYVVPGMKVSVKQANAGEFEGAPVPEIFKKPGATLTGPIARYGQEVEKSLRSIAYQLLSGAEYVLLDGEDSFSQLGTMSLEGQRNLKLAISKDPVFMKVAESVASEMMKNGKRPQDWNWRKLIDENYTTRIYRVRGLHLDDRHIEYTTAAGKKIALSATLADAVLFIVNNYKALLDQGAPLALYFPKVQSAQEAALFAQILDDLEATLEYNGKKLKDIALEDGKPGGIIKVMVLIENVRAALQLMPIRAAFGRHLVLINTARWDYLATVIKAKDYDQNWVPDDFSRLGMTYPFMHTFENAVWRAANTPDKNGNTILWEGGMEVQIPTIPDNIPQAQKDEYIKGFMAKASANKLREALAGAPRAWVAHPDMVPIVANVFKDRYGDGKAPVLGQTVNLNGEAWTPLTFTPEDAHAFFKLDDHQVITVKGLRQDISVYMQYKLNVLTGQGAASIKPADDFLTPSIPYLMEDRATDEGRGAGARKKFRVKVAFTEDDQSVGIKAGERLSPELFETLVAQEYDKLFQADDRLVHNNVKTSILPITRLALEKFVTTDVNIPWSVDLEGVVLGVSEPAKAGQLMDAYIAQLRNSGGISRMTQNPQFVDAAMAAGRKYDDTLNIWVHKDYEAGAPGTTTATVTLISDKKQPPYIQVSLSRPLDEEPSQTAQLITDRMSRAKVNLNAHPAQYYVLGSMVIKPLSVNGNRDAAMAAAAVTPLQRVKDLLNTGYFNRTSPNWPWTEQEIANLINETTPQLASDLQNELSAKLRDAWAAVHGTPDYLISGGVMDGPSAARAAEAGAKFIYLSGWQASHHWGQPDLAKYPLDTVPNVIKNIYKYLENQSESQQIIFNKVTAKVNDVFGKFFAELKEAQPENYQSLKESYVKELVKAAKSEKTDIYANAIRSDVDEYFKTIFTNLLDEVFKEKDAYFGQSGSQAKRDETRAAARLLLRKSLVDYRIPVFADADAGHQSVGELTRLFILANSASMHLEDQLHGEKKCGHMAGKVLVSTREHYRRLLEAQSTALRMGSLISIISRTDAQAAKLLASNEDARDHFSILGTTKNIVPLAYIIRLSRREIDEFGARGDNTAIIEKMKAEMPGINEKEINAILSAKSPEDLLEELRGESPQLADLIEKIWQIRGQVKGERLEPNQPLLLKDGEGSGLYVEDIWNMEEAIRLHESHIQLTSLLYYKGQEMTAQQIIDRKPKGIDQEIKAMEDLTNLWDKMAGLKTYANAVADEIMTTQTGAYVGMEEAKRKSIAAQWKEATNPLKNTLSINQLRSLARTFGIAIDWSWEPARTYEGFYQIDSKMGAVTAAVRSRVFARIATSVWMEQDKPNVKQAAKFIADVNADSKANGVYHSINLSPSFNWSNPESWSDTLNKEEITRVQELQSTKGFDILDVNTWGILGQAHHEAIEKMSNAIRNFSRNMGEAGNDLQFVTIFQDHTSSRALAKAFGELLKDGAGGFVVGVQQQEQKFKDRFVTHQTAAGVPRVDAVETVFVRGSSATGAGGKASTEHGFATPAVQPAPVAIQAATKEITVYQEELRGNPSVERLDSMVVELHILLVSVRARVASLLNQIEANGKDEAKLRELNEELAQSRTQRDGVSRLLARAIDKILPLEGSDKVAISLETASLDNIKNRFNKYPEIYEQPELGVKRDLFILSAGLRSAELERKRSGANQGLIDEKVQRIHDLMTQGGKLIGDKAMTTPGGIDLSTNGMQWKVTKDGRGVEMDINPALVARIQREGINWLSPVIFKVTPVTSVWPLVGLQAPSS